MRRFGEAVETRHYGRCPRMCDDRAVSRTGSKSSRLPHMKSQVCRKTKDPGTPLGCLMLVLGERDVFMRGIKLVLEAAGF